MDLFPKSLGRANKLDLGFASRNHRPHHGLLRRQHRDGLWNYAQRFAMSDNSYGTNLRALDPGARSIWFQDRPTA